MQKSSRRKGKGFTRGLEPGWEYTRLNNWEYPHRVKPKPKPMTSEVKPNWEYEMYPMYKDTRDKPPPVVRAKRKFKKEFRRKIKSLPGGKVKFYEQQASVEHMMQHIHSQYQTK